VGATTRHSMTVPASAAPGEYTVNATARSTDGVSATGCTFRVRVVAPTARAAYLWADQPAAADYEPTTAFSFRGAAHRITRTSPGRYTVTLRGQASPGGLTHVTAYGGTLNTCQVRSWFPARPDEKVEVNCQDRFGNPADNSFTALFTAAGAGTGTLAYLWADSPTTPSFTPHPLYSYNSAHRVNTVTRDAVGLWTVRLPGLARPGGHVQVTPYGDSPARCSVRSWVPSRDDEMVGVACFGADGTPQDTRFSLSFTDGGSPFRDVTTRAAYLWSGRETGPAAAPDPYSWNSTLATNTVTRESRGSYLVQLPGMGPAADHVQVSSYGPEDRSCQVWKWTTAVGARVRVTCHAGVSGAPIDTPFTLAYLS
jgi:hypothetical protein